MSAWAWSIVGLAVLAAAIGVYLFTRSGDDSAYRADEGWRR